MSDRQNLVSEGIAHQLVRFERRNDYDESLEVILDHAVLDSVLGTCKGRKLCVICVTGESRSGKGFLLNRIKDHLLKAGPMGNKENNMQQTSPQKSTSGFSCTPGYKQDTKGIWIWSNAILIGSEDDDEEEIAVLLLETQGFQEGVTEEDEISAILGLGMLTSSVVVMNFMGASSQDMLECLDKTSDWGAFFAKKGVQKPLQKLSFLVRDWTHLSEYNYGGVTGKKMLSKLMRSSKQVGKILEEIFEEINCFLLPHIGGQALLQTSGESRLQTNQEFSRKLGTFLKHLTKPESLPVKRILGNDLTPQDWKQFLIGYVDLFNDRTEMEWGPPPESIWRVTMETTGKLKIDQGLAAYREVFRQRVANTNGGYIRETTIEGLHPHGKRKALQAFAEITIGKEGTNFENKLLKLLEDEKEKMKTDNEDIRKTFTTDSISKAMDKLRIQLNMKFSFEPTPEKNSFPPELMFYEDQEFYPEIQRILKLVEDQFLEAFQDESEDEIFKLLTLLLTTVEPIVDDQYINRNTENRNRAIMRAKEATDKLKEEYMAAILEMLDSLPETDTKTLQFFHKQQIKTLTGKFYALKVGKASFKEEWWNKVLEEIEEMRETIEANLKSTQNEAARMVEAEKLKYKNELTEIANGNESEKNISEYHENAKAAILGKFAVGNPLRKSETGGKEILEQLEESLEQVYTDVVVKGVLSKRDLEETLRQAREKAINFYKEEVQKRIDLEGDFIMDDRAWQDITSQMEEDALDQFENILHENSGVIPTNVFEEEMGKMEKEISTVSEYLSKENQRERALAESQVSSLISKCNKTFEADLGSRVMMLKSIESLIQLNEDLQKKMLDDFEAGCTTKNLILRERSLDQIKKNADTIFSGVEEFFKMTKTAENVGMLAALLDVKQFYFNRMEGHFNNRSTYFSEEELLKLHETAETMAMEQLDKESLSQDQIHEIRARLTKFYQKFKERNDLIWRSFQDDKPALGIDLGTTYCCVAVYHKGKVIILRNSQGDNTTPSYVLFQDHDKTIICGKPAKNLAFRNPESTIFDAKRIIGRRITDKHLQEDMECWPFTVKEEDGIPKVEVNGVTYFPEEISAELLRHLKQEAEQVLGLPVENAVITVPAYFTDGQRKATKAAGEIAGLKVLGILNEPTAAAVAYRHEWIYAADDGATKRILVFDLGGGTFDVAVLELGEDKVEEKSVAGNDHLGGQDLDKNLMKLCIEKFKQDTEIDVFKDKDSTNKFTRDKARSAIMRLQAMCEEAKKQLSTAPSATISFAAFYEAHDLIVEVTKGEFEKRNEQLFKECFDIMEDALKSAKLRKEDIHEVVLVGGSTRIPILQKKLESLFKGKALNKKINPDEAVAYGAAIQAAILNGKPGVKLFDFERIETVTPMSLGIEVVGKLFSVIIPRGTKIPHEETQAYFTCRNWQTSVFIKIYQGENSIAVENRLLGDFILDGIPPAMAEEEGVDVTMKIDADGILTVEAVCKSTGDSESITVNEERGRMSEEIKQQLIAKARSKEKPEALISSARRSLNKKPPNINVLSN